MEMLQVTRKNKQALSFWGPFCSLNAWWLCGSSSPSLRRVVHSIWLLIKHIFLCNVEWEEACTSADQQACHQNCPSSLLIASHHLAASLWNCTHSMGMVPLHPRYCGFPLHWVSVWSVPSKPRGDRACWPSCGEHGRTAWMPGAMITTHGCFGDTGMGAVQRGRGVCTSDCTKVPLGAVSAVWLWGVIAAHANISELAWVPAVQGSK